LDKTKHNKQILRTRKRAADLKRYAVKEYKNNEPSK